MVGVSRLQFASPTRMARVIRQLGWVASIGFASAGLAAILALWAAVNHWQTASVNEIKPTLNLLHPPLVSGQASGSTSKQNPTLALPSPDQYVDDIAKFLRIAAGAGIAVGSVTYSQESDAAIGVEYKQLEFRTTEDYSRFKKFLALLLDAFPHGTVKDLAIDHPAAASPPQYKLRFVLAYRSGTKIEPKQSKIRVGEEEFVPTRLFPEVLRDPVAPINLLAALELAEPPKPLVVEKPRIRRTQASRATPPVAVAPPPAPAVEQGAAPVTPKAPPLPFVVTGQLQGSAIAGGKQVVFLTQGAEVYAVRVGDALGADYRVEAIAAGHIEFTYLPLGQKQRLSLEK
jgi:hypothetical protein